MNCHQEQELSSSRHISDDEQCTSLSHSSAINESLSVNTLQDVTLINCYTSIQLTDGEERRHLSKSYLKRWKNNSYVSHSQVWKLPTIQIYAWKLRCQTINNKCTDKRSDKKPENEGLLKGLIMALLR